LKVVGSQASRIVMVFVACALAAATEPHSIATPSPTASHFIEPPISWITGISDVAQIVFVRKRLVEIQYFRTTITAEQREEFGRLVDDTIRRI
jgi:hypothetical protein